MYKTIFTEINQLISNSEEHLKGINQKFESLLASKKLKDIPNDVDTQSSAVRLIMQYRMDSQNALIGLMRLEQSILQLLGVENLSTMTENIDRLAYALGFEDLQHCLSALNRMIEMLLQMAYKQEQHQHTFENHKEQLSREKNKRHYLTELKNIKKHQQQFVSALQELNQHIEKIVHLESIGPVHDHISALQGPVSRFYQLIQSGLEQSHELLNKIEPNIQPENSLQNTLNRAETLIDTLAQQNQHPKLFDKKLTSLKPETLEQRAAKRRLGKYFHH